jgi:hypothetical protein
LRARIFDSAAAIWRSATRLMLLVLGSWIATWIFVEHHFAMLGPEFALIQGFLGFFLPFHDLGVLHRG